MPLNAQDDLNLGEQFCALLREKYYQRSFPEQPDLTSLKGWIDNEINAWSNIGHDDYLNTLRRVQSAIGLLLEHPEPEAAQHDAFQKARVAVVQHSKANIVPSASILGHALLSLGTNLHKRNGFMQYLDGYFNAQGSADHFDGFVQAALSNRTQPPDETTAKLNATQQDMLNQFNATVGGLRQHLLNLRKETDGWLEAQKEFANEQVETRKTVIESSEKEWKTKLETLEGEHTKSLASLRHAFEEQTRLQRPAKYWKELFKIYQTRGRVNAFAAIVVTVIGMFGVALVIANLPSIQKGDTFEFYRTTALLAFAATLIVLLLQLFIRITLSSMHLSRDAMERHQLTHVFLALIKDGAIEPSQKDAILASLFSRSDTGLLKNDGTPALPVNAVLESILKKQS